MKVIIINGPMGVGKTTVGRLIADKCPGTAFIDGDLQAEGKYVTLVCEREILIRRWKNDHECEWRTDEWLNVSLKSLQHFASMNNTIDTSNMPADRVADMILTDEAVQ